MLWENTVLEVKILIFLIGIANTTYSRTFAYFSLKVLSLKNCEIEFSGGETIGVGLQRNSGLKELYLNSNKLKDVGSKEIAQGIKVSESLVVIIILKSLQNNIIKSLFIFVTI